MKLIMQEKAGTTVPNDSNELQKFLELDSIEHKGNFVFEARKKTLLLEIYTTPTTEDQNEIQIQAILFKGYSEKVFATLENYESGYFNTSISSAIERYKQASKIIKTRILRTDEDIVDIIIDEEKKAHRNYLQEILFGKENKYEIANACNKALDFIKLSLIDAAPLA